MASRKAVSIDNLKALGIERLATLLLELAESDAEVRRRLKLELTAEEGGAAVAAAIGKRLTALRSARSFVDWRKTRELVRDLDLQRATITDRVAPTRPDLALDLLWRFMDLAEPVLGRVDDSNGAVGGVFHQACDDLATVAAKAVSDPVSLADRVLAAVRADDYGFFDDLITGILPALGEPGTKRLEARLTTALGETPVNAEGFDWPARKLRRALQQIADARGDVDAWIALIPPAEQASPHHATQIGQRLLAVGRAKEAVAALEGAVPKRRAGRSDTDHPALTMLETTEGGWEDVLIEALEADGQKERAQQLRWRGFERSLSVPRLRAFLKRLPDFEDFEAERRARQQAFAHESFYSALHFFLEWPDHAEAARLVRERRAEIDGNAYMLLDPGARQLESKYPLAATLLLRAMITDTLEGAKSSRYKHAARHLRECRSLAASIPEHGAFETHETFARQLRAKHGRKASFWEHVAD